MPQISVCKFLLFTQALEAFRQLHGLKYCSSVTDSLYTNFSTEYQKYFPSCYLIPEFESPVGVSHLNVSKTRCFDSTFKINSTSPKTSFFSFSDKKSSNHFESFISHPNPTIMNTYSSTFEIYPEYNHSSQYFLH